MKGRDLLVSDTVERLSDRRYVFVIVGFLLDASDELVYGVIRDDDDQIRGRFRTWEQIPELLRNIAIGPA
jgi:hypothetical protein